MQYPGFARTLLRLTSFGLDITGRRRDLIIGSCDRLFDASSRGEANLTLAGATFRLNLDNPSERLLNYAPHNLLRRYRKSDLFFILSRLAGSGGVFVDIGANLGIYSLLARTLGFGTVMFEPEPVHYAFLARNSGAMGGSAFSFALSNECGTMKFFVSGEANPGSSSLVLGESVPVDQNAISVDVLTFDDFANRRQLDLSSIRLIKIDVEGNEERTARGMQQYLCRPDAAPIWCEVRGPQSGRCRNSVAPVTEYMQTFGYQPFKCFRRTLRPFRIGVDPSPQVFDLLFAVPHRHQKVLSV